MEKEKTPPNIQEQLKPEFDIEIIDGKEFKKIPSGYTLRQFYSHETPEKGPGPGWDTRWRVLEKYNVKHPSQLPEEPHYWLEEIKKEK